MSKMNHIIHFSEFLMVAKLIHGTLDKGLQDWSIGLEVHWLFDIYINCFWLKVKEI